MDFMNTRKRLIKKFTLFFYLKNPKRCVHISLRIKELQINEQRKLKKKEEKQR